MDKRFAGLLTALVAAGALEEPVLEAVDVVRAGRAAGAAADGPGRGAKLVLFAAVLVAVGRTAPGKGFGAPLIDMGRAVAVLVGDAVILDETPREAGVGLAALMLCLLLVGSTSVCLRAAGTAAVLSLFTPGAVALAPLLAAPIIDVRFEVVAAAAF